VEHVRHSKCRQEFLNRVKANHEAHAEKKGGEFNLYFGCKTSRA
jgi:large subunit ribosomal protein L21e